MSLRLGNTSSTLSEGVTPKSSFSIGSTALLQGSGGEFLRWRGLCPALEDDIKRGSEDSLEDGGDGEYSEDRNRGRPAHCEDGNLNRRVSIKWVEWDRPKKRHPLSSSLYTCPNRW